MSIESAADEVIAKYRREAEAYRSGHSASLHVLIGQVRRRVHGKGDVATIAAALNERLGVTSGDAVEAEAD